MQVLVLCRLEQTTKQHVFWYVFTIFSKSSFISYTAQSLVSFIIWIGYDIVLYAVLCFPGISLQTQ
jgi:hypothetical protein